MTGGEIQTHIIQSENYDMFCYQCEQTSKGTGCSDFSVCGKDETSAILQDLLVHGSKGIAQYAHRARAFGAKDPGVDRFLLKALFITVTNVNFDAQAIKAALREAARVRDTAKALYENAARKAGKTPESLTGPATWVPAPTLAGLVAQGQMVSVLSRKEQYGPDINGLQELLIYGIKGAAAYADHAQILGQEAEVIYAFFAEALSYLAEEKPTVDELLAMCLKCGEINLKTMEVLEVAHTSTYGHPVPTPVRVEPVKGKAILISGHDLKDLEKLLQQTAGMGINIYTHGEMLPAHGYPQLKQHKHLVGNYGGAWQDQRDEFRAFPGAILMTTNCFQEPQKATNTAYSPPAMSGGRASHISPTATSPRSLRALWPRPASAEDGSDKTILVGFGRNAVLGVADKVVDAVKTGAIKHFFLVGGCDGARAGRNYYTEFAESLPKDCVILTLACGKYRFNKLDFGDHRRIPRLLDIGQCNDAYAAIQIAVALSKAFNCGVNDLPLSLVLSWYEQKAVAILLTLLYLGIRNIRLGPTLPAFVTPNVLNALVEKFNLMPIKDAKSDIAAILN